MTKKTKNNKHKKLVVLGGLGSKPSDFARFNTKFVFTPKWKYGSLTSYLKEFYEFIKKNDLKDGEYTALGFSMGAYILACSTVKPYKTVYASLTPLFEKYINDWPEAWRKTFGGKKRFNDRGKYVAKPSTSFLVGNKEPAFFLDCALHFSDTSSPVYMVKAGHDLFEKDYFNTLQRII